MGWLRIFAIFLWTGVMVPWSLIVSKIRGDHRIPLRMARSPWGKGVLFLSGLKLAVRGLEQFDSSEPRIYIANHSSYLDIPCLFAALPVNLYFIAKEEVKKIPFVGFFMKATQMIFIDRSSRQAAIDSMNEAGDLIKKGRSVLVFPEGSRKGGQDVHPFKKGAFVLARQAGIPVVPVALTGTNQLMPSGSLSIKPGSVTLQVGQPIHGADYETVQDFMHSVRRQIVSLIH